jgi:protein involved in polysaccharide export with SLBB domain
MKLRRALGFAALALLGLFVWGPAARAQDSVTRANVGDILHVDVEGRADISGDFTIDKNGNITLPSVGRVSANGRTTSEIGTDIARRMSLISSKITQVSVTMAQIASRRNFVLGAVLLPGMYVFRELPTVWEAITEAGGPADDADLTAVEVLSETQPKPTLVDVTSGGAGLSSLPRLHPGDTVRVPRLASSVTGDKDVVYVFGAVGFQGPQPLNLAPDLVSAFIRSGPSGDADFKNVEIVRKNGPQIVRIKVSMDEYFGRGDIVGNPRLQSGDTIHFPRSRGAFSPLRIVGAVASILAVVTSITVLTR